MEPRNAAGANSSLGRLNQDPAARRTRATHTGGELIVLVGVPRQNPCQKEFLVIAFVKISDHNRRLEPRILCGEP
jgi:hypothetical protein